MVSNIVLKDQIEYEIFILYMISITLFVIMSNCQGFQLFAVIVIIDLFVD